MSAPTRRHGSAAACATGASRRYLRLTSRGAGQSSIWACARTSMVDNMPTTARRPAVSKVTAGRRTDGDCGSHSGAGARIAARRRHYSRHLLIARRLRGICRIVLRECDAAQTCSAAYGTAVRQRPTLIRHVRREALYPWPTSCYMSSRQSALLRQIECRNRRRLHGSIWKMECPIDSTPRRDDLASSPSVRDRSVIVVLDERSNNLCVVRHNYWSERVSPCWRMMCAPGSSGSWPRSHLIDFKTSTGSSIAADNVLGDADRPGSSGARQRTGGDRIIWTCAVARQRHQP